MVDNNPTRENEPPMEPLDPPTVPTHTVELDQTHYPDLPAPADRPRRRKGRSHRGVGCWRWVRTLLAISAMGLALIIVTGAIIGLVIYNSLSGELAEDMEALRSME